MHLKSLKSVYVGLQTVTTSEATTRKAVSADKVDTGWVVWRLWEQLPLMPFEATLKVGRRTPYSESKDYTKRIIRRRGFDALVA